MAHIYLVWGISGLDRLPPSVIDPYEENPGTVIFNENFNFYDVNQRVSRFCMFPHAKTPQRFILSVVDSVKSGDFAGTIDPQFITLVDKYANDWFASFRFVLRSSFFVLRSSFFVLRSSFFVLRSSFFVLRSSFFVR
jgi:hypothetical protein